MGRNEFLFLLQGLKWTVVLSAVAFAGGTVSGLAVAGFNLEAWQAVAIAFTLHASAFLGEIWRGSIEAVPRGQVEAAKALSLDYVSRMKDVILPQAIRISLPA